MISGCAFDLGNTLVDDTTLYDRAIARFAATLEERELIHDAAQFVTAYDRVNRSARTPFVSHTFGETVFFLSAFAELGVTGITADDALGMYREIVLRETTLSPAIAEALVWLGRNGMHRAILSNERAARVEGWLTTTGVRNLFEVVFVSETAGVEKPDPAFFAAALDAIGLPASEVLMFGDNTIADGACKDLGVRFVHVTAYSTTRWYFENGHPHKPDYALSEISRENLARCFRDLEPEQQLTYPSGASS